MTENAYLVGLRLAGKKVVVIGGGTVAQRRVPVLIAGGAQVHVVARAATPAVEALAEQQPGITLEVRDYRDAEAGQAVRDTIGVPSSAHLSVVVAANKGGWPSRKNLPNTL